MKSEAYFCVCSGPLEGLVNERCALGPEGYLRRKKKKRSISHFMKGKNSTRTNQLRRGAQDGNGIGKKLQNETTHRCVERFVAGDLTYIGLREAHIVQAGLGNTRSSPSDRARVAFDAYHFSRRADQTGCQHGNVADPGAEIQHTLTWANACVTE